MQESGIDTSIYSAHSTRHAATSAANCRGVTIDIRVFLIFNKIICDNDFFL